MTKPLARELRPAVEAIDFITTAMENEDDDSTIEDEWKYIALIIGTVLCSYGLFVFSHTNSSVKTTHRPSSTLHLLLFRSLRIHLLLLEH